MYRISQFLSICVLRHLQTFVYRISKLSRKETPFYFRQIHQSIAEISCVSIEFLYGRRIKTSRLALLGLLCFC